MPHEILFSSETNLVPFICQCPAIQEFTHETLPQGGSAVTVRARVSVAGTTTMFGLIWHGATAGTVKGVVLNHPVNVYDGTVPEPATLDQVQVLDLNGPALGMLAKYDWPRTSPVTKLLLGGTIELDTQYGGFRCLGATSILPPHSTDDEIVIRLTGPGPITYARHVGFEIVPDAPVNQAMYKAYIMDLQERRKNKYRKAQEEKTQATGVSDIAARRAARPSGQS